MAQGVDNIIVGSPAVGGGLFFADIGTKLPKTVDEPLDSKFIKGGYIGEDGLTKTIDASDENVVAWGGDIVKTLRTEHNVTYSFEFLESANADVLKLIFGEDNVSTATGTVTVKQNNKIPPRKSFVINLRDGDKPKREVIPDGQISLSGDVTYSHADVIRYAVTITAFPDANGDKAFILEPEETGSASSASSTRSTSS